MVIFPNEMVYRQSEQVPSVPKVVFQKSGFQHSLKRAVTSLQLSSLRVQVHLDAQLVLEDQKLQTQMALMKNLEDLQHPLRPTQAVNYHPPGDNFPYEKKCRVTSFMML